MSDHLVIFQTVNSIYCERDLLSMASFVIPYKFILIAMAI
jgi:hypothetical protein